VLTLGFLLTQLLPASETIRAKQGDAIKLKATAPATQARFGNITIRLFHQADGSMFGLMPVSANHATGNFHLEYLDAAGKAVRVDNLVISNAHFAQQNVVLSKNLVELKAAPGDKEAMDAFRTIVSEERLWAEPLQAPLPGCMVSPFGVRRLHNGRPTGNYHGGIDQRGAEGSEIRAVAAGTVRLVRPFGVSGNTVGVDHGQGFESLYLHMSKFQAVDGQRVQKGDVLGYVGSTGRSTAPHLHWSLMANGVGVNPAQWMTLTPCENAAHKTRKKSTTRRAH
jgi:murein DD-endopeptidase MepM/ murein hydrolase activator NlpD